MADNNFIEGKDLALNYINVNPYANEKNAIQVHGFEKYNKYYASFDYVVAAGGATTTITPKTGNLDSNVRFYHVEVSDGDKTVVGALNLASPAANIVIDSSTLDTAKAWTLFFSGENDGKKLQYKTILAEGAAVAGVSASTIPSDWTNVSFLLKLTSTDDANYTAFPAAGLEIADGDTVNLNAYLASGTELANGGSYIFSLEAKKLGLDPVAETPTVSTNDVVTAGFTSAVTFPYEVKTAYAEILNTITIKTSVAGAKTDVLTMEIGNTGVKPSVSFTFNTTVGA